jgi:redox-sensitive bicupin YhaK (pirin superfamily)
VVVPRTSDLGDGFTVRRALPAVGRRLVGPFVFFDEFGPITIARGRGLDVRPHPHIGLATVTYLFDGEILHRDGLGSVQPIRPGAVNWMTAGRGIVHSERTPPERRDGRSTLHGLQTWVALPAAAEECAPTFAHHPASAIPTLEDGGVTVVVVVGSLHGATSPVETASDTYYAEIRLAAGARYAHPAEHEERAAYVVDGSIEIDGDAIEAGRLVVFRPGVEVVVRAPSGPARIMVLGGAAMDGPRHVWWNFVSSRPERIEEAARAWRAGRFGGVPGETEFIPLPDAPPPVVYP